MPTEAPTPSAPAPITNFAEFEAAGGKIPEAQPQPEPEPEVEEQPEAGETSETEADTETAAAEQEKAPQPKRKLSLSEERDKLLKQVTDLRRERRELTQHTSQPAPAAPQAATTAKSEPDDDKPPARPKLSTFKGTLEEYEEAVEKYDRDNTAWMQRQFKREQQAEAQQKQAEEGKRIYGEKVREHVKLHPEYDEEIAATPMTPLMVDAVFHYGPELGQALIDDQEEARRIHGLPPAVQLFEMGRLAGKLANGTAPKGKAPVPEPEEEAPEPVKVPAKIGTSNGSAAAALNRPDLGAKNFAQYEAIANRLAADKRRKR